MRTHPPQYNLTLEQAVTRLREEAAKNETQTDTDQLQGMTPDESYNVGYATCLNDLLSLTGPDPREVGIIEVTYTLTEEARARAIAIFEARMGFAWTEDYADSREWSDAMIQAQQ